jgi:hypothetical protein
MQLAQAAAEQHFSISFVHQKTLVLEFTPTVTIGL